MSHRQFFSRVLFCISILSASMAPSLGMDVPLNVNNNNNVPLEEATEEVNIQEVENEPNVEHPVILAGYENAHAFHLRLLRERPQWFGDNVQSYYKRINPSITSRPQNPGGNEWNPHSVSIGGRQIMPNAQGEYIRDGISFNRNAFRNFDPNNNFAIPISDNNRPFKERLVPVDFMVHSRKKILALPHLENYNACVAAAPGDQFSCRRRITLRGEMRQAGHIHMIEVEVESGQREAVTLQGMELIFNKDEGTTKILFDFVDVPRVVGAAHEPVALMNHIECRHSNEVADATVFCIKDHKVFNCAGKPIHSFFDIPATRRGWVPDGLNFYDQNNGGLVALPSRYAEPGDRGENDADPIAWVLGEGHNSLYQRVQGQELELQNGNNDYLCCDNRLFYLLLPYTATCTDYLSPNPANRVRFDYFLQVKKPSLRINVNAVIKDGGHRDWASGLYKWVRINNQTCWQNINTPANSIDFENGASTQSIWPAEPLTAQEIIKWGDAGQRFYNTFYAQIRHCNRAISNKLNSWTNLTSLDFSRIELANDITWDGWLFRAIGFMRQLTKFTFAYNNPNIPGDQREDGWQKKFNYYLNLAVCLDKLRNLRSLDIQGLWLKNHAQLGSGCLNENSVSPEVAGLVVNNTILRNGIRFVIEAINGMAQLESLNIDGIPNHGASTWDMCSTGEKVLLAPSALFNISNIKTDRRRSEEVLTRLVIDGTYQLAQMPSLRTISVYSPGGNCINYFSENFRMMLAAHRALRRNLPALAINAEVLQ